MIISRLPGNNFTIAREQFHDYPNNFTISRQRGQRNCINNYHFYVGVQSLEMVKKFAYYIEYEENGAKLHEKIQRWDTKSCVPTPWLRWYLLIQNENVNPPPG